MNHLRVSFLCAAVLVFVAIPLTAQKPSPPSSTPATGGSAGGGSIGTVGTIGTNPSRNTTINNNTQSPWENGHPLFLTGSVLFDDGSAPNTDVRIERVCSGNPRLESHSDTHGHFSFQVGGQTTADMSAVDASTSNSSLGGGSSPFNGVGGSKVGQGGNGNLWDCELRASYPGYLSDVVELGNRRSMDDPNVGTIVLHRLANVKGTTISMTSALAPKNAQKNFQKAVAFAQKGKLEEAEGKLRDATKEYPKYAEAWFELGQIQERLNKTADATADYLAAIDADAKFVSPYDRLARLNAQQSNWKETAKFSKQAVDLNPVEFPTSFWYNAIANYNLKNEAEAEKSARSLVKLDRAHRYPDAERLLAELSSTHGDLAEAAVHLKAYLEEAPNGSNVEQTKKQLARIEEARAAQAKSSPAPVVAPTSAQPPR